MSLETKTKYEALKIPKQLKYWAERHGIKQQRDIKCVFKSKNRHWRINCYNEFQMSETFVTFDRWANSLIATVPLPKTQAEFDEAIIYMKKQAILWKMAKNAQELGLDYD